MKTKCKRICKIDDINISWYIVKNNHLKTHTSANSNDSQYNSLATHALFTSPTRTYKEDSKKKKRKQKKQKQKQEQIKNMCQKICVIQYFKNIIFSFFIFI